LVGCGIIRSTLGYTVRKVDDGHGFVVSKISAGLGWTGTGAPARSPIQDLGFLISLLDLSQSREPTRLAREL
jgi:hypothetical protein